jgi:ADP-ribose pyrophosphatase YjhB (NUDIX family)
MKILKLIAYKIATIYWKIFRPQTFPGGGVKSGEMFEQALKREILEELGLYFNDIQLFGVYQNTKQGKIDTVITFISTTPVDLNKAKLSDEINRADFFSLDMLPTNVSPGSRKRIQEYLSNNFPIAKEW